MNAITLCMSNPVSEFRADEMNNWYTSEHVLSCMQMEGSIAVQRFKRSKFQPKNAYLDYSVITVYELFDLDAWTSTCNVWGLDSHKMPMSTSFDIEKFIEDYWTPDVMVDDFADFADFEGDKSILLVKLGVIGNKSPEQIFTKELLRKFRKIEGFKTLHLLKTAGYNMSSMDADPSYTHMLVGQLNSSYFGKVSWDTFIDENPDLSNLFKMRAVIYEPVMARKKASEILNDPVSQALYTITRQLLRNQLDWGDEG